MDAEAGVTTRGDLVVFEDFQIFDEFVQLKGIVAVGIQRRPGVFVHMVSSILDIRQVQKPYHLKLPSVLFSRLSDYHQR